MTWQPMETAPKDRAILLRLPKPLREYGEPAHGSCLSTLKVVIGWYEKAILSDETDWTCCVVYEEPAYCASGKMTFPIMIEPNGWMEIPAE